MTNQELNDWREQLAAGEKCLEMSANALGSATDKHRKQGEQMPNIDGFSHGMIGLDSVDDFERAYIESALWSSYDNLTEDGGEPMDDRFELSPEFIAEAIRDCKRFREVCGELLDEHDDDTMGAHDFWLTRNGHGAGFWDGDWPANGDRLTEISKVYGECNLYVGDDGKVYSFQG